MNREDLKDFADDMMETAVYFQQSFRAYKENSKYLNKSQREMVYESDQKALLSFAKKYSKKLADIAK